MVLSHAVRSGASQVGTVRHNIIYGHGSAPMRVSSRRVLAPARYTVAKHLVEADYLFLRAMAFHPLKRDNIGWDDTMSAWSMVCDSRSATKAVLASDHPLRESLGQAPTETSIAGELPI